ncbi:MAG: hypothetical protein F6K14_04110 [Symploca sp. SIO2C1]|nr:hypothetical protein [Symploca sp. SIO2C1]
MVMSLARMRSLLPLVLSVLLSGCAANSAEVVKTRYFSLTADPVDYQNLESLPVTPEGEAFSFSFFDFDRSWQKYVRTVNVRPVQGSERPRIVIDEQGHAYQIEPGPDFVKIEGRPVMADTPLNWYAHGPTITLEPRNNTLIVPLLPGHRYSTVQAEIEKTGGRILGIFGTTFKGFQPKTKEATPLSYLYFNPNHLPQNRGKKLPVYRSSQISGQSAPNILLSGIITYQDGRTEYLDFSHLQGIGNNSDDKLESIKQKISKELEQLEQRQDVVLLTIDTHGVMRKPEDIPAVVVRGGGKRGGPFLFHETQSVARGLRIFDDQNRQYLGSMITPSLLMRDCLAVAKKKYGKNAVIQFLDGDAPAAAYFEGANISTALGIPDPQVLDHYRLRGARGLELIVEY